MQENSRNGNEEVIGHMVKRISNPVTKSKKWLFDINDCISELTYGVKVRKLSRRRLISRKTTIFLHPSDPTLLCWATKRKKLKEASLDLKNCKIKILKVRRKSNGEVIRRSLIDVKKIKCLEDDLEIFQTKNFDINKDFKDVKTRKNWKEEYFIGILSDERQRELVVGFENKFVFFRIYWFLTLYTTPDPYTTSNLSLSLLSEESSNYQRMSSIQNFEFLKSKESWNSNFKLVKEGEYEEIKDVLSSNHLGKYIEEISQKLEVIMKMNFGYSRKEVFQFLLIEKNHKFEIEELNNLKTLTQLTFKFNLMQSESLIARKYFELATMVQNKVQDGDLIAFMPIYLHSGFNLINQNYYTNYLKFKRFNWLSSCCLGNSLVKAASFDALRENIESLEIFLKKLKLLLDFKYRAISLTLLDVSNFLFDKSRMRLEKWEF